MIRDPSATHFIGSSIIVDQDLKKTKKNSHPVSYYLKRLNIILKTSLEVFKNKRKLKKGQR